MQKTLAILIGLLSLSGLYLFNQNQETNVASQVDEQIFRAYQEWKSEYGFNYNGAEESYRFEQYASNYKFIEQHNASGDQLVLGMNQFSGMDVEEFADRMLTKPQEKIEQNNFPDVPVTNQYIDWVQKGAVMKTTNQANCGSCWAFSTIAGLQGLRYLDTGILERLSAQQLVSCIPLEAIDEGGKNGCDGSQTMFSYNYTYHQGIETWENYPYVSGVNGEVPPCHHNKSESVYFNRGINDGFVRLPFYDVAGMKKQIMIQPYSISVGAANIYFKHYKAGTILDNTKCSTHLDHAITLVGMKDEGENPYWIVQNSWGDSWGHHGYGMIAIKGGSGICGINLKAVYPTSNTYPNNQQNLEY